MKITFHRNTLLAAISPMMGTVSTKNTITAIEGILIDTMEDGSVRLTTYDMNKGVRTFLYDCEIEGIGSFIVNAQRFLQYVKVMPDAEITLEMNENLSGYLYSGKSSFTVSAVRGKDFPTLPELRAERGFRMKGEVLKNVIGKVIHSVAVAETRPVLCGAYFVLNNETGEMEVVSCDSYTLSRCSVKSDFTNIGVLEYPKLKFIIPGHALGELCRLLPDGDKTVDIYLSRKHAIFHMEKMIFFTRMIDSEYIDYERIMPKDQTIFFTVERERFLAGLERAGLVAEEKIQGSARSHVKVVVSGDMLSLTSSSVNGKVYDEMPITHTGDDLEIAFNCRYLINSVRAATGDYVDVTLKNERMSLTIEPSEKSEEENYFYMVLPVKLNG
jgi:DNA polymerase-3 subunit beta